MTIIPASYRFSRQITVSIIDKNPNLQHEVVPLLKQTNGYACLQIYQSTEAALRHIFGYLPDVLLIDLGYHYSLTDIECIRQLKEKAPNVELIILTNRAGNSMVFEALRAGACGCLLKSTSPQKMLEAITEAYRGGAPMSRNIARMVVNSFQKNLTDPFRLTRREKEVLQQLCRGKSYKMVAGALFVSHDTVRSHIKSIYRKLAVNSKSEAVIKALEYRLV